MFLTTGRTYKQTAQQLRRSAAASRRGSGRKPAPGRAHGEPDAMSFYYAAREDVMAAHFESLGEGRVTQEDIRAATAAANAVPHPLRS
jgi:hypothetical protein